MIEETVAFIESLEGFRPTIYEDTAGKKTIGIGQLWNASIPKVMSHYLAVNYCERTINNIWQAWSGHIYPVLNDNQRTAFTSFCYNLGVNAFLSSTLLKLFNAGDIQGAADQFLVWDKEHRNGVLEVVPGLLRRREIERAKFLEV